MSPEIVLSLELPKKKKVSWFDKQIDEIAKGSISKQLVVGGVSGWCAGIVFTKVGKTAASALAGGLLMFQIAQHQGYVKVNWPKLQKDIEKAKHKFNKKTRKELPWILEEIQQFVQDNKFLVTGFGGGFLLGLATF